MQYQSLPLNSILKFLPFAFTFLLMFLGLSAAASADNRLALVIGNSGYKNSPLVNPTNDATLMTGTLKAAGFSVTRLIDADQRTMKRALLNFSRRLRETGAVGLFYFAGHAVQVRNKNYLIPLDANIRDESELDMEAIDVTAFLATMERSSNAFNIVILDACRNNPFRETFREPLDGLAKVEAPRGSFVAYSTSPGKVAYDGTKGNSPYTLALAKAISKPGLTIEQVFKQTRRDVLTATGEKQIPWENSSLTQEFYFMDKNRQIASKPSKSLPAVGSTFELTYWNSIKDSKSRTLFRSYLNKYPDGSFSPIAAEKVRSLTPN